MTEKTKLLKTLFKNDGKKLLNLKFCRFSSTEVSEEAFCATVNKALFEIDTGIAKTLTRFDGDPDKTVSVHDIARRFSV